MNINDHIKNSLFLKIILIFLAAHLTIAAAGFTLHKYFSSSHHYKNMNKNMVHYSAMLIKQMGFPPDTLKARQISDSLNIAIQFTSQNFSWSSKGENSFGLPSKLKDFNKNGRFLISLADHGFFVQNKTPDGNYLLIFQTDILQDSATVQWRILSMVLFMMFILTIIYYIIRTLLKPILQLDEATRQLSAGNLDYKLETTRRDELGDLVHSFNLMITRIKEMLKARDHLLLDASHELRSPLTRIKVALEFLEESNAKQNIREDINEMEAMITELLEGERLESPYGRLYKIPLNIVELVQMVCRNYESQKPDIILIKDQPEIILNVDAQRLKMALKNIIQNAFKYSDPNGKAIEITVSSTTNEVSIFVKDYGQGIPQEDIPFIFEPFYRVDKSRSKETGGYGLGMSLAKKIIRAHGGKIEVESEMNKGTIVKINLKK